MMCLVDRKPFSRTSSRRLSHPHRRDYALVVSVACSEKSPDPHDPPPPDSAKFEILVDTGCTGAGSLSLEHFNRFVNCPLPFDKLGRATATVTFADGREDNPFCWFGNLWIYPEGISPGVRRPVCIGLRTGLSIFQPPCDASVIGMTALRRIRAKMEIDYVREIFSIWIPADLA